MSQRLRIRRAVVIGTAVAAGLFAGTASADTTIQVVSDQSTLGVAFGAGLSNDALISLLNEGDTFGLTFSPVDVGGFGSYTPVPANAPAGTQVVNIAPGDGESGYFEATFNLPAAGPYIQIQGAANVDDFGRVFLNGVALTPEMPNGVAEFGDFAFSSNDSSLFQTGQNVLLVADANTGGGPSGAAFFATISISDHPFPIAASWMGNDGNWSDATQWSTNPNYPNNGTPSDTTYDVSISSGAVNLDVGASVNSLTLSGGSLGGAGILTLDASVHSGIATISVIDSAQTIAAAVNLASDTVLNVDSNSSLTFADGISGSGNVTIEGGGAVTMNAGDTAGRAVAVDSGQLNVVGTIAAGTSITVNGGGVSIDSVSDLPNILTFVTGSLSIGGDLHLGVGHALGSPTLNSGDQVTVGGTLTLENGVTQLQGGTLSASLLAGAAGSLNFTAGTLNITDAVGGSLNLTAAGVLGATLNMQGGMTLNVADTLTVAADGSLAISAGTINTHELVNNSASPVVFSSGSLTVDSLTLDALRPIGRWEMR